MKPSVDLSKNQGGWTPLAEVDLPQPSTFHLKKRYRSPNNKFKNSSPSKRSPFFDDDYNSSRDFSHKKKQEVRHYKNKKFSRLQRDLFQNNTYEVHETPREGSKHHHEQDFEVLAPSFSTLPSNSHRELESEETAFKFQWEKIQQRKK